MLDAYAFWFAQYIVGDIVWTFIQYKPLGITYWYIKTKEWAKWVELKNIIIFPFKNIMSCIYGSGCIFPNTFEICISYQLGIQQYV